MREQAQFTIDRGILNSFCDPRSPWAARIERVHQRAAAPVLARSTPTSNRFSQEELDAVAANSPADRAEALRWMTPAQRLAEVIAPARPFDGERNAGSRSRDQPPSRPASAEISRTRHPRRPRRGPQKGLRRADPPSGPRRKRLKRPSPLRPRPSGLGLRDDGRSTCSLQAGSNLNRRYPTRRGPLLNRRGRSTRYDNLHPSAVVH